MSAVPHCVPDVPLLEPRGRTPRQARRALRALWRDVEPFLTEEERAALGGPAFENVFPLEGTPAH
jgi:hypothetical protein